MNHLLFAHEVVGMRGIISKKRGRRPFAEVTHGTHKSSFRASNKEGYPLKNGDHVLIIESKLHTDVYVERL
ncbi:MAG: hypothetical protein AAF399_04745 [Bacteroidota bacterium]